MGLSSMPTASEGVLTVVLVNTALSVSIVVEIFRSLLGLLGLRHYRHLIPAPIAAGDDQGDGTVQEPVQTGPVRFNKVGGLPGLLEPVRAGVDGVPADMWARVP
ncbi:putative E3 ubiquitin-protein ligase XERICO [Iris pallida]|uniref:E3 ubiquitin-protein ligase XERICO n=1 Tax=Iris pallida TaxID=29817 RepID=A0AAX6GZZ7_IRIPA|nr:putative E3 ubiquitin-protein ligase XERICO [Iris pallida]KAJ6850690.1 putative E3 ubiquitin-protein ligase XERICO [Iris pallida]